MTCFRIQSTNYSTQNLIDKVKLQFLTSNFGWRKSIILTWTLKTHKLHIKIRSAGYKNVKKSNMTIKVLCTQSENRLEFMFYTIILYLRRPLPILLLGPSTFFFKIKAGSFNPYSLIFGTISERVFWKKSHLGLRK